MVIIVKKRIKMVKKKVVKKVVKKKARSGKNVKVVKSKNLRVKKNVKPMGALGRLNAFVFGNFRVGLSYVGEVKNYIWFLLSLFLLVSIFGFIYPVFFREEIIEMIKELILRTEGLSTNELIRFIMENNIRSSFVGMFGGILLGIIPLLVVVVNAYVLGFVANSAVAVDGYGVLLKLFPHGIFEIPAILISVGVGLKIGVDLIRECVLNYNRKTSKGVLWLFIVLSILFWPIAFLVIMIITLVQKKLRKRFWVGLKNAFRVFIFVVVPLLVIAGIIEGILIACMA